MQVRIKKDLTRAVRLAAVKSDKTVPEFLDALLFPIFFGKVRPVKKS